jgi:hypothetical protein
MTTVKELSLDLDTKMGTLRALKVSSVSYSIKEDRWTITYDSGETKPKYGYYYAWSPMKRLQAKTLGVAIEKLKTKITTSAALIVKNAKDREAAAKRELAAAEVAAKEAVIAAQDAVKKAQQEAEEVKANFGLK